MVMKILLYISFVFLAFPAEAQMNNKSFVDFSNNNFRNGFGVKAIEENKDIEGSSLLFDTSRRGYLVLSNGKRTNVLDLNCNLLTNVVRVSKKDELVGISLQYVDSLVILDSDSKLVAYVKVEIDEKSKLAEVVVEGEVSLVKVKKCNVKKPTYNKALDTGSKATKVSVRDILYFSYQNNFIQVPKSYKKIKKSDFNSDFLESLNREKPSFRKTDELTYFLNNYNSKS